MDLQSGSALWEDIMTNPAYDSSNNSDDDDNIYKDPAAMFKKLGIGKPGGLKMPSMLTAKEVVTKARPQSQAIVDHWNQLNGIIARHEATIQKRWMKKTVPQRKSILLESWPEMAASHRPDIQLWKSNRKLSPDARREAFLFPQINLEDLTKPRLLLLLLNSRARNPPHMFARADFDAMHFGLVTQEVLPGFLNEYVMMFTADTWPNQYGKLMSWDDHPDAFEWLHSQRGIHPGGGLLILEAQERIYRFLTECCAKILHDIEKENLADQSYPIEPEPPSVSSNAAGLASLVTTVSEAPYRLPAKLDLEQLGHIIQTKSSEADDHIWSLREDPEYYASTILDWKEHRQELLLDTHHQKHSKLDPYPSNEFWKRVIGNMISWSFARMEMWACLSDLISEAQRLQISHADNITPTKDLPEPYRLALLNVYHHARQFLKGPIQNLKTGFVASPPMRPCFEREPEDRSSTMIRVVQKQGLSQNKQRDDLTWTVMTLFDEQRLHLMSLPVLLDELERLISSSAEVKDMVSPWVADQISDLAVFTLCLQQLELYQPWSAMFEQDMVDRKKEIDAKFDETQVFLSSYRDFQLTAGVVALGIPTNNKFYYPDQKRATRENVEAMQSAESSLDSFWKAMDLHLEKEKRITPRLKGLLSQRMIRRTPDWDETGNTTDIAKQSLHEDSSFLPLSGLYHHWMETEPAGSKSKRITAKSKEKTRGTPQSIQHPEQPAQNQQPFVEKHYAVDKRSMKVFKVLFFVPSRSSQPGEISWLDFLHAMSHIGFRAVKHYGSVWQFTPTKMDVERGINFHEPHPSGKLRFQVSRRFGRRLNRTYGLYGGSFVAE